MPLNADTLRSQISVLSNSSSTQTGINLPRLGGERGVTSPPPPATAFLRMFSAMQKDTGTKIGDFSKNFMGNILIYTSVCQLTGCCYGNKVFPFLPKSIKCAIAMLATGQEIAF